MPRAVHFIFDMPLGWCDEYALIVFKTIIIIIITIIIFICNWGGARFFFSCAREVSFTYFAVLNVAFWLQRSRDQWGISPCFCDMRLVPS
jgi:hypothetical protein